MNKNLREERNDKRDPVDVAMGWVFGLSVFLLLVCVSVISPLLYVWAMGIVGMLLTLAGTAIAAGELFSTGPFGFVLAGEVVKVGFEVVAAILSGLAEASR